jgi:hypothetical protein
LRQNRKVCTLASENQILLKTNQVRNIFQQKSNAWEHKNLYCCYCLAVRDLDDCGSPKNIGCGPDYVFIFWACTVRTGGVVDWPPCTQAPINPKNAGGR